MSIWFASVESLELTRPITNNETDLCFDADVCIKYIKICTDQRNQSENPFTIDM